MRHHGRRAGGAAGRRSRQIDHTAVAEALYNGVLRYARNVVLSVPVIADIRVKEWKRAYG